MTITTPAPDMSDAQHRALTRAAANPAGFVARTRDASLSTLIGLEDERRRWADVVWGTKQRRGRTVNTVTGATITEAGRRALALVNAQREQQARDAEVRRTGVVARMPDPFAAVRAVNGPELVISF